MRHEAGRKRRGVRVGLRQLLHRRNSSSLTCVASHSVLCVCCHSTAAAAVAEVGQWAADATSIERSANAATRNRINSYDAIVFFVFVADQPLARSRSSSPFASSLASQLQPSLECERQHDHR